MSTTVSLPHTPNNTASQATVIEGNRVAAEVYAAVLVAQQVPRSEQRVREQVTELCKIEAMAKKALYRFPVGGNNVEGLTIQIARELVRIWGNTQFGMSELSRTDDHTELLAYAWDMQNNARSSRIVIVPHKSDRKGKAPVDLTDMREILTNNTSQGSRQLRETIFSILPWWLTELAEEICRATLVHGGGVPLVQRRAECVRMFAEIGVREEQLVAKVYNRPVDRWDGQDLATLAVCFKSIRNHEISKEAEFPVVVVTTEQITSLPREDAGKATEDETPNGNGVEVVELPESLAERVQLMHDLFSAGGVGTTPSERQKRLRVINRHLQLLTPIKEVGNLALEQVTTMITFMVQQRAEGTLISALGELAEPVK